ncbi:hypothetical protein F4861DRAFT_512513 [Xylaria intraflava]|nr:hypothetical protein F4861DRAFT_512513 [Xylaria intraflava]
MAISTDEALLILNQSYKDTLIQAGKHFRLMAKDGPSALIGADSGIQAKTADALSQYHLALAHIEAEIIRAKSVLLRDLENLRAARAPAPVTASVPIPTPQSAAPAAPMMELPSAAAHSHNLNFPATTAVPNTATAVIYPPGNGTRTGAPFPDMGMGMSTDVVDLTFGEKKPSPRLQPGSVKSATRPVPSANIVKPLSKSIPKSMPPAKVTPVPPPQIPRAFQALNTSSQPKSQLSPQLQNAVQTAQSARQAMPAKAIQVKAVGDMLDLPPTGAGNVTSTVTGNGKRSFADMTSSLSSAPAETTGAPPAPMPEFDLATFAPQPGITNVPKGNMVRRKITQPSNASSNMDEIFNLGDAGKSTDSMFDLGGGEANDSTFDDMMFFGSNNGNNGNSSSSNTNNHPEMGQFNEAYFHL